MSTVANDDPTRSLENTTLLALLSNHLVLQNTAPYLSPRDRLALAASSKSFQNLFYHTPGVFRHLDLTSVKRAQFDIDPIDNGGEVWRNVQLDENLTEDECVLPTPSRRWEGTELTGASSIPASTAVP
jgi:hypothetical protein